MSDLRHFVSPCTPPVIIGGVHILFYTPAFPPFHGGGERYARSLALALAACAQQITVVTSQAQDERQLWGGTPDAARSVESDGPLTVIRYPLRPFPGGWRALLAWRKVMVLISRLPGDQTPLLERMARRVPTLIGLDDVAAGLPAPPQLVHGFNLSWEYTLLAARDLARRLHLPFVITPFAHFGADRQRRVALNNTMDHQRRLLQQAAAVLALTSHEGDGFTRYNIHPRRLAVVGGGVDDPPPLSTAAASDALAHFAITPPYALFVGRVTHDKGAIHAAQAVLRLAHHGLPLTLVLAGRVAADFHRFLDALAPDERARLRLLGPIAELHKHALLQQAAMLLLPSQAESFGIVILEAWLHATPVVAARAGGIPAVVDDGENGLLVPFSDVPALAAAMQRLLAEEPLRNRLGRSGQDKVQREYAWSGVASRVLDLYREVAA